MKHARLSLRMAFGLCAGLVSVGFAGAQIPTSVSLSEVWGKQLPTAAEVTNDQAISNQQQVRSFAVNDNPGSAWKGTMYLPRRSAGGAPADIFYWQGTQTLQASGPNLAQPSGKFSPPSGFTAPANAWWIIAVADDDLVYAGGLNGGVLYRFNPDLTEPTVVVPSPTWPTGFIRQMFARGKGMDTEIWYITGAGSPANIERWEATSVDGQDRPTAFAKTLSLPQSDGGGQHHQSILNSAGDTFYYTYFTGTGSPGNGPLKVAIPSGVRDPNFPARPIPASTAVALDSQDRVLYATGYANPDGSAYGQFVAMNPITGEDISDPKNWIPPSMLNGTIPYKFSDYIEFARYSDRHYFFLGNWGTGSETSVVGVFATDVPAPAPTGVLVRNPGTGNSLQLTWQLPNDPEVTGVIIYRSQTAGQLGTALNTTPIAGTSYTDNGLQAGTTYYYTVQSVAVDPFTSQPYAGSNSAQAAKAPSVLQVPAAPSSIIVTDTQKGGEVNVQWTTPLQYADAIRIYRSEAVGALGSLIKEIANPTPGTAASYLDPTAVNGKTYYYTVRAANELGESTNTQQFNVTPTDKVAPTFVGIQTARDLGFPGLRLSWNSAQDNTGPITYNIYAGSDLSSINFTAPVGSVTGQNSFDLTGLPLGQDAVVVVRAQDAAGNEDTNTKIAIATPARVIVDPDQAGGVNRDKFNPQPDTSLTALQPAAIGGIKGNAPDLVESSFAPGAFFFQTNDKKGKSSYTLNIPTTGTYDISAFWSPDVNVDTPGFTYHITYPNGTTEDVVVDQLGGASGNGGRWNLLVDNKALTPGTLTVVGDATTSSSTDATKYNVSSAIRALLVLSPTQVPIYTAATRPTIDANITDAEWSGANSIVLGRAFQDLIPGNWTGAADYSANVRLKWNTDGLFVAGRVTNDVLSFPTTLPTTAWSFWDGLEIYLGLDPLADPTRTTYAALSDYQIILTAWKDGSTLKGVIAEGAGRLAFDEFSGHEVAFATAPSGYTFEAYIPWSVFEVAGAIKPSANQVLGFNLHGNDNDKLTEQAQDSAFSLSTLAGSYQNPSAWITAQLAGTPPARPRGDVNLDGAFTREDVVMALRIAGGLTAVSSEARQAGDVSGNDGKITIEDATKMEKALVGGIAP